MAPHPRDQKWYSIAEQVSKEMDSEINNPRVPALQRLG
jgi:hypothetical protein